MPIAVRDVAFPLPPSEDPRAALARAVAAARRLWPGLVVEDPATGRFYGETPAPPLDEALLHPDLAAAHRPDAPGRATLAFASRGRLTLVVDEPPRPDQLALLDAVAAELDPARPRYLAVPEEELRAAREVIALLPPSVRAPAPSSPWALSWEAALAMLLLELARYLVARCGGPPPAAEMRVRAARLLRPGALNLLARWDRRAMIRDVEARFGGRLLSYGYLADEAADACLGACVDAEASPEPRLRALGLAR